MNMDELNRRITQKGTWVITHQDMRKLESGAPDHYAVVRVDGHELRMIAPPHFPGLVAPVDFEQFWTGAALLVSLTPITIDSNSVLARWMAIIGIAVAASIGIAFVRKRNYVRAIGHE